MSEKFRVEAHHAYTKAKPDELDLSPGDIIRVLSDEHASWWVGHKEGTDEQGWFPSNFVRKIEPKPESKSKSKPKREVRIVKQYDATDEDDLSLRVGDIVEIKKEVDGWYLGRLNGNIGMFPVSYAEELQGDLPSSTGRPLPVPPVPGASTQPPPVPGALSRRSTASSGTAPGGALPTMPPTLPSRTPPLPPRASTDVGRPGEKSHAGAAATAAAEEGADDSKKDKTKSSHRISRLFGTKKHKNKDAQPEGAEQPRTEQQPSAAHDDEEDADESALSPDIPSRPLPQPARMNSPPPPAGRAVPPIPPMGMATLPPIPAAAMPSQPTASAQLEPAAPRRPSVSSVATTSSIATAPIPPVPQTQRSASNVSAGEDGYLEEDADADNAAVYAEDSMSKDEAAGDETEEPNSRPSAKLAKIIEDYEAQSPEELNLLLGDVVTIINRGTENEERWKGEYHGKKGYFPGHVVELIEESAGLDEEGDESGEATSKPKGFKLAAYGVQQGGLGSIFAAGGMPALRKSTPRKNSEAEPSSDAPTSVLAPVPTIPKLRSVQRSQPKEDQKEEQPNFLANLNRVPRKPMASASSEESPSTPSQPMPVPALPISRKSTTTSFAEPEAAEAKETLAGAGTQPENVPDAAAQTIDSSVPLDATVPQEERSGYRPDEALDEQEEHAIEDDSGDVQSAEDNQAIAGGAQPAKKSPALDPVKSPALASAKRLVRRGPRQMPTAEGLKKNSEESQSQSLRAALQNDKSVEPEAEPEVVKATPPAPPEKPKNIARHSQFNGPQLPVGGFKASGRVGSAMASRLAALQARASGTGGEDNEDNEAKSSVADTSSSVRSYGSRPSPSDATSPPPVARKPSFVPRSQTETTPSPSAPSVSSEWQKQIEDEQSRLRSDVEKARRNGDQVDQLASRLAASERENQAHRQTISQLEGQIQTLTAQLSALKTDISSIQRSVSELGSNKGIDASEVTSILRGELRSALQPLEKQNLDLLNENRGLDKKINDLRAYVDELVVEEEQQ